MTVGLELFADGLEFPEGPVAMSDGSLIVCEIKARRITRIHPSGRREVLAELHGAPNGAAIGPDGRLWICDNGRFSWIRDGRWDGPGPETYDYTGGRILALDLDSGEIAEMATDCGGRELKGPNDIVSDGVGGLYFTDHGKRRERDLDYGGVYWISSADGVVKELAFPLSTANGVGLSPDGRALYATETDTGRLLRWMLTAPGVIAAEQRSGPAGSTVIYGAPGYGQFDSLAVEASGNICVGTLIRGGISVVSPTGELLEFVPMPEDDPYVTNICFGGPDLRTAYITSSGLGRVYTATWPRPGLREPRPLLPLG